MLFTFRGCKMKRTDKDIFNHMMEPLFYQENCPISLDEYCKGSEHTTDIINFRKFIGKEGLQYDKATKANWDYRYECFKDEEKKMFKKKKESSNFLDKSRELLKNCYDKGAIIEYEEDKGKWVDLPKGLPIDFSKFDEGKIRLKLPDPTLEQVEKFKNEYGNPIVTDWDLKNIPMLSFCFLKDFCRILPTKIGNRLQWDSINIWRYYGKKEYLPETPITELKKELDKNYVAVETEEQVTRNKMINSILKEMKELPDKATIRTFMDVVDYVCWEFHNIDEKMEDLYARTEE